MRSKHRKSIIARRRHQRTEEHEAGRRRAARDRRRRGVVGPTIRSAFDEPAPGESWREAMVSFGQRFGLFRRR